MSDSLTPAEIQEIEELERDAPVVNYGRLRLQVKLMNLAPRLWAMVKAGLKAKDSATAWHTEFEDLRQRHIAVTQGRDDLHAKLEQAERERDEWQAKYVKQVEWTAKVNRLCSESLLAQGKDYAEAFEALERVADAHCRCGVGGEDKACAAHKALANLNARHPNGGHGLLAELEGLRRLEEPARELALHVQNAKCLSYSYWRDAVESWGDAVGRIVAALDQLRVRKGEEG